jgi:hypothetical protein
MHIGCTIKGDGPGGVSVRSVEHAEALIRALTYAIDNDFLCTNAQLDKYHTSATDTRRRIREKIRLDTVAQLPNLCYNSLNS